MRIKFSFSSVDNSSIKLSVGYNYILQAFIYRYVLPNKSEWLHDEGFKTQSGKKYKLFTFSSILNKAKYDRKEKMLVFKKQISFFVASPVEWIIESIAENIVLEKEFILGKNRLVLTAVEIPKQKNKFSDTVVIRALSPIEVHSTFKIGNKNKTHYYTPFEKEFVSMIKDNLINKFTVFYGKRPTNSAFEIKPLFRGSKNEKIIEVNGITIKGWRGLYQIKGNPDLIKFAFDVGLGSRNSMGFGFIGDEK